MAKGFWGTLTDAGAKLGLVEVQEVADAPLPAPEGAAPPVAGAAPSTSPSRAAAPVDQAKLAELDESVRKQLVEAMTKAGAALVEELSDLLESLAEDIPTEKGRYASALKILKRNGHPVSAILQDFDKCIGALEEDNRAFSDQLKEQFEGRIGERTHAVATLDAQIESSKAQIQRLQDGLTQLAATRAAAQSGITDEQVKRDQIRERFGMAYGSIRSTVESQRAKIAQYGEKL